MLPRKYRNWTPGDWMQHTTEHHEWSWDFYPSDETGCGSIVRINRDGEAWDDFPMHTDEQVLDYIREWEWREYETALPHGGQMSQHLLNQGRREFILNHVFYLRNAMRSCIRRGEKEKARQYLRDACHCLRWARDEGKRNHVHG